MTNTNSLTYTVVDIRKTFEGFEADLRMIAARTRKWTPDYVDKVFYDIIKLAENKYLLTVSIVLLDLNGKVIKASKFTVNADGKSITSQRAGENEWSEIPATELTVHLSHNQSWDNLSTEEKENFKRTNNFKIGWVSSNLDNTFPHLNKSSGQLYASNGYELKKENYK